MQWYSIYVSKIIFIILKKIYTTSPAHQHCSLRFFFLLLLLFLKIQPRINPWLPCIPWRPWFFETLRSSPKHLYLFFVSSIVWLTKKGQILKGGSHSTWLCSMELSTQGYDILLGQGRYTTQCTVCIIHQSYFGV